VTPGYITLFQLFVQIFQFFSLLSVEKVGGKKAKLSIKILKVPKIFPGNIVIEAKKLKDSRKTPVRDIVLSPL